MTYLPDWIKALLAPPDEPPPLLARMGWGGWRWSWEAWEADDFDGFGGVKGATGEGPVLTSPTGIGYCLTEMGPLFDGWGQAAPPSVN